MEQRWNPSVLHFRIDDRMRKLVVSCDVSTNPFFVVIDLRTEVCECIQQRSQYLHEVELGYCKSALGRGALETYSY